MCFTDAPLTLKLSIETKFKASKKWGPVRGPQKKERSLKNENTHKRRKRKRTF